MLIATILEKDQARVLDAARVASRHADLLELRLDALHPSARDDLEGLLRPLAKPVVCSCRRPMDGGRFEGGEEERASLLRAAAAAGAAYLDVEAGSDLEALIDQLDGPRFLLSHHDLEETPRNLEQLALELASRPGIAMAKLVTRARRIEDNLLMRSILRSPPSGAPLVAFCLGSVGVPSRLLALAWGAAATYGAAGGAGADGQLPVADMDTLYAVREVTDATVLTGVVGRPLAHSLSPLVHNAAYRHLGLDFLYLPLELRSAEDAVRMAWELPLRGFSVTLPYKVAMLDLVDDLEPLARRAGAVNTVLCDEERNLGLNTDITGGVVPLRRRLALQGRRVALLGTGGAARALALGLLEEGAEVRVFGRNPSRAQSLAKEVGVSAGDLSELPEHRFDVLINATPVGMEPDREAIPVPPGELRGELICDLVYNPRRTRLLREAEARGIEVIEGLEMFLEQAAEQFELFSDRTAPRSVMRDAARAALQRAEQTDGEL